ncbi:uncharacterized protein KD926_003139 [Aspergillus affinis]|uniref:uncharacterized protein n=1 Tax=Aspergillus affinis TaxID=1070780 RepID=UPI0022FE2C8E|nr:uncharacterized protein KD926_003139 [Aspergillus affinis]KAI9035661.1 hypothetical protein KD926_003139 [Aspergillus affinis]
MDPFSSIPEKGNPIESNQNPPSPPSSAKNSPGTDDHPAPVRVVNAEAPPGPSTSPRTTEPTEFWDDDDDDDDEIPADVMGISEPSMGREQRDSDGFVGAGGYNALKSY